VRWRTGRRSQNVEDRRGQRTSGLGGAGLPLLPLLLRLGGRKGGIWMILILVAVLYFTGGNLGSLIGGPDAVSTQANLPRAEAPAQQSQAEKQMSEFVSVVLADTEDTWSAIFSAAGERYTEPTLVLYRGLTRSSCGLGQAAMGPFYCPTDNKVYLDFSFFEELSNRFRAPGDFAQAYVIAHEVGHHVQTLLGIGNQVRAAQQGLGEANSNRLSVRQELQADCFAGVWAHHADRTRHILEQGDVEEALAAATAIGDDRLQRQTQGRVSPDSFTHGTSAQRVRWFKRGLETGKVSACDTFQAAAL
jgi:predicted metalloprotease